VKERRVVLAPEAGDDLGDLYQWIAHRASPEVALGYLERVEVFLGG
jgi:toxin ParE1/3/4